MITVIIPTNRVNCLIVILEKCIKKYKGNLFNFEIHDSSEDNKIREICLEYDKINGKNLRYYHYRPDLSVDEKALTAIKSVNSEYFWLFGDGNLVDFNKMEELLIHNHFDKFDVLNIDTSNRRGYLDQDSDKNVDCIYQCNSSLVYAKKYFSRLTYWGSAIIRTRYYKCVFYNNIIDKYVDNQIPWWIACSIFESIAYWSEKNFLPILGVMYTDYISYNPAKKDHWWTHDEKYYLYVFTKFNEGIRLLPPLYDKEKSHMIYFFRNDALVNNSYLLHLRSLGVINRYLVKKYKSDIEVINGFYYKMLFFSFIPKSIAYVGNKLKPILKKILKSKS